jgi:biopolymer transport protein TolR
MAMTAGGSRKSKAILSEINVTPLVDVMLVLLIMFMVTTPLMQQGIEVNVPKTASSGVEMTDEPFILVIHKDRRIEAGKARIAIEEIRGKMQAIFKTRKNKQVYIQADKQVDYGIVAETMAEIRAAGITNIGLITLPKDK